MTAEQTQPDPGHPESVDPAALDALTQRVESAEARAEAAEKRAADVDPSRFAVYDRTFERYLAGVHDTKDRATKAAKDAKVKRYRIDEV